MEDGSLLPAALQFMQKLRDKEQNFDLPFQFFENLREQHDSNNEANSMNNPGTKNAIIISIYCIDSMSDVDLTESLNRNNLLRKLAIIQNIIHKKLIPVYNKRYKHLWFQGGEGLCLGLHCQEMDGREQRILRRNKSGSDKSTCIPHLRAVVSYGPNPLDEWYAMAMMKCISVDLLKNNGIKVAIECFDLDDGQIMLIEGADTLPSWVDDVVGVAGMDKRVYLVDGSVSLLPPSIRADCDDDCNNPYTDEKHEYALNRCQALVALVADENNYTSESSLFEFNVAIQKRLNPFCKVLNQKLEKNRIRSILKEYLHTASIVLPLYLAVMIRYRPDLIPLSILSFCRQSSGTRNTLRETSASSGPQEGEAKPFENLVYTSIMLPKTLYAMLLTGAGHVPPPMNIPKHYKSMELNRVKRQCKNGGMAYAHFRHAVEAGVRLSLGFDWLSSSQGQLPGGNIGGKTLISFSLEDRISGAMQIDIDAGGDGKWIEKAWNDGPNQTQEENKIDSLIECPIWNPEILKGGICAIDHAGKTVVKHITEASKFACKKIKGSMLEFPIPRADEVDSDEWIDLDTIDELEFKMNSIVGFSSGTSPKIVDEEKELMSMDKIMGGLEKFVSGTSDIRGVSSENENPTVDRRNVKDDGDINIDEEVFIKILHRVLKSDDAKNMRLDDIVCSKDIHSPDESDPDLLKFFSNIDLDFDGNEMNHGMDCDETDFAIKELMNSMDDQLASEELDRHNVPSFDRNEDSLSFDDPIAIKANVLSNILESIDAQEGTCGPASIMLAHTSS